ncbi:MAG TPA: hypothetical protein VLG27_01475 [Candidatus Saccharimonadia bacterium]|nr:hypothetical protein [Candidatus Saccharimonadia bacterium]
MDTGTRRSLYMEVVTVTQGYFGPAADRFVSRQIRSHLSKEPEKLNRKDLLPLIDWISLTMALLIEDEVIINRFVSELRQLANGKRA